MKKDFRQAFNLRVNHDETAHKFTSTMGKDEVMVAYTPLDAATWRIDAVTASPELRSMNIHGRLLEYVLELALQEKINVQPNCAYAKAFINHDSRFQALVAEEVAG